MAAMPFSDYNSSVSIWEELFRYFNWLGITKQFIYYNWLITSENITEPENIHQTLRKYYLRTTHQNYFYQISKLLNCYLRALFETLLFLNYWKTETTMNKIYQNIVLNKDDSRAGLDTNQIFPQLGYH